MILIFENRIKSSQLIICRQKSSVILRLLINFVLFEFVKKRSTGNWKIF